MHRSQSKPVYSTRRRKRFRERNASAHEAKAEFRIEFEDGSSATLCLADPDSSVAVRDKNNAVEYLG